MPRRRANEHPTQALLDLYTIRETPQRKIAGRAFGDSRRTFVSRVARFEYFRPLLSLCAYVTLVSGQAA